jgi:hypothetical protein
MKYIKKSVFYVLQAKISLHIHKFKLKNSACFFYFHILNVNFRIE